MRGEQRITLASHRTAKDFSRPRVAGLLCAGVLLAVAGAGTSLAHGGPPLRLGVTTDALAQTAARLTLVHLREGVGFAVDWREFPDEAALRSAFSAGKVDIAVVPTRADQRAAGDAAGDCAGAAPERQGEELARVWLGAVFPLRSASSAWPCARAALIVSRGVLDDPRFGILGREIDRLAGLITTEDQAAVSAARERGGERAAVAAARAALAAKAGR